MSKSDLEIALLRQIRMLKLPAPEEQVRFHPKRRWRFDLCWPAKHWAVEIDGGTFSGGRHVRPLGFEKDAEKLNEASLAGWRVLRVTGAMVNDGRAVQFIERALGQ